MASYPKWLYHPTKEAAVVADEAAEKALGAGWVDSPAKLIDSKGRHLGAPVEPEPDDADVKSPKKVK